MNIKQMLVEASIIDALANTDQMDWIDTPNEPIKGMVSSTKGRFGQLLVAAALRDMGHTVAKGGSNEFDLLVDGNRRVEVKLSTRWSAGCYKFQQLREPHDFSDVAFVFVDPTEINIYFANRASINAHVFNACENLQHVGQAGNSGVYWLSVNVGMIPNWFNETL